MSPIMSLMYISKNMSLMSYASKKPKTTLELGQKQKLQDWVAYMSHPYWVEVKDDVDAEVEVRLRLGLGFLM